MANVLVAETSLQGIANAIREKNGTEDTYKPSEMPQAILDIESGGGGGAVDYTKYAKTLTFDPSFAEVTENVYLDLSKVTTITNLLWGSSINCEKIAIKVSGLCTGMNGTFRSGSTGITTILKEVELLGDTSGITTYQRAFYAQYNLEKIIGEIDFSNATNIVETFYNCQKLTDFTPKAGTIKVSISFSNSPNLTEETIQAIVDGFADMTGQTAPVLTVHPTVKAKIVANVTWLNTLTSKNVTLA